MNTYLIRIGRWLSAVWLCCAVTKLVETVQPTVDFSYHKYCQAHDVVVASEAYNRALEAASAIIHKVPS